MSRGYIHPKVQSATAAASVASLLAYVLHVPEPVAYAIVTLAVALGGWLGPKGDA